MQQPAEHPAKERKWLPALGVLFAVVAVVMGGYVTAGALSVPQGRPLVVGDLLEVSLLSGWEVAGEGEVNGVPAARLTRGNGNLDLLAADFEQTPGALVRDYVTGFLEPGAGELTVSEDLERVQLDGGLEAVRIDYAGSFGDVSAPIEGQVTAVSLPSGEGAVFDGWAPQGLFAFASGDIDEMIASAVLG